MASAHFHPVIAITPIPPVPSITRSAAPMKKHRYLSDTEVKTLQIWAKTHQDTSTEEIQKHIEEAFGVKYAERTIRYNRTKWGFTLQAHKAYARALKPDEVKTLKAWAKTHQSASTEEIQKHIEEAFGVKYCEGTIQRLRTGWDFIKAQTLNPSEVKTLQAWAKTHQGASNEEIQKHIEEAFGVKYAERTIRYNKDKWGFTSKDCTRSRALKADQISILKEWAKTNKTASIEEIQKYLKETFGVSYSERTIQKTKTRWGFTVKPPNSSRLLSPDQMNAIKNWAKTHQGARTKEIQKYIEETFGVKFSDRNIRRHKAEWGFTSIGSPPKIMPSNDLIEEFEQGALELNFPPIFVE